MNISKTAKSGDRIARSHNRCTSSSQHLRAMASREGDESSGTGVAAADGAVAGAAPVGSASDSGKTKTMKAPGRNVRISRESFERDPKGYFRDMINRRKEERAGKFRE